MSRVTQKFDLFVPNMFPNITGEYVVEVFRKLDIGEVRHVDFNFKKDRNGKLYKSAHIFMHRWFNCETAIDLQNKILTATFQKPARVVYNDPYNWVLLENKTTKPVARELVRQTCHANTYPKPSVTPAPYSAVKKVTEQEYDEEYEYEEEDEEEEEEDDIRALTTEIDNLRMENEDLSRGISELETKNAELQHEVEEMHGVRMVDHSEFNEQLSLLEQRIADLEKENAMLRSKRA
jgi:hypothetical protein